MEETIRPVIVNGAGPVGLTMACELARHGVPCRIFDQNLQGAQQSRALGIFPRTIEVFSIMGMVEPVLAEGQRLHGVNMYNEERKLAALRFEHLDSEYKYAIALPQSRTEPILEAHLATLGGKVERGMEMIGLKQDASGVRARYRAANGGAESDAEGSWIVGCDGAHSAVRHLTGMTFEGGQYEEEFLLADVKVESELATDEAHLILAKDGLFALFLFRGGRGRIIATGRRQGSEEGPTLEEVRQMAKDRCSMRMELSDPVWTAWFRISHRMVKHYRIGRAFLAGDAAHIHSPAGGQGMNTGIQDAFNLAWKLALVSRGLAEENLLESYEAERMPVAHSVIAITDRMTRVGTTMNTAMQHLRDIVLPVVSGIPVLTETMTERMAELSIGYRGTAWVENHGLGPVRAGDRAPDLTLFDREAREERTIFGLLRKPGYLLLAFDGTEAAGCDCTTLGELPGSAFRVMRPGKESAPGSLEDRDCRAPNIYGAGDRCLYVLIRPDGYIGFRGENPADLADYVERIAGEPAGVTAAGPAR